MVTSSRPPRGTWSPPVTLSGPSVDTTVPAIAIGPDGTTTIAWRLAPTEDDFVVQASTRTPGHGWAPAQSISQQSIDEQVSGFTDPQVRLAAATDGSVTAVWPQWITTPNPLDSYFEVQSATRSAAGTWATPTALDPGEWGYRSPEVAAGPNGQVAAVYGMTGVSDNGVYVRIRQGSGAWGPRQRLGNQYWGGRPDVAYAPDGTLGVVWASGNNSPTVTTLPPGGQWATPRVLSQTVVNYGELELAAGPGPGFVATWTSDESGGQDLIYAAAGGASGPWSAQAISAATAGSPVVAVKSDGTAVAMWLWRAPAASDEAIQASVRPAGGAWEAPSTVRDVPADGGTYEISLASGPARSLTAMWAEWDAADLTTSYASIQDPAAPATGKIKGPVSYTHLTLPTNREV